MSSCGCPNEAERNACIAIDPVGFHLRAPPAPHELGNFITPDDQLFETIHMGSAVVDAERWQLVIDGLVQKPLTLSLADLRRFPQSVVTAFHECYGSPLTPPVKALWRIGNVEWTGVRLQTLLELTQPLPAARFVWSEGLDRGSFGGRQMDRYQKDLPIEKATYPEVLVAYEINGKPLRKERGGPVRLIVPGWFGTNSTKWICRLSLQVQRAPSPFTTVWYNERDPTESAGGMRPVWTVEPNSMITSPAPGAQLQGVRLKVRGWAWSADSIKDVSISANGGKSWVVADVAQRTDFSWQQFKAMLDLPDGMHQLMARATSLSGVEQPLSGRRNHVHTIAVEVTNGNTAIEPGWSVNVA
jgi:DMSO/TMAO reductase YedYZ molybdopterin-dependent catalytic subunit